MAHDLPQSAHGRPSPRVLLERLATGAGRAARITHTEHLPARVGRHADWPDQIRNEVIEAVRTAGIERPWEHQARVASHAIGNESVVVATGTASGKSLAYQVPVLSALLDGSQAPNGRGATALYLAPTKALAADQRRAVASLAAPLGTAVRAAVYDGDTPVEEREWVRQYATYVLTNPDMLHLGILPGHARWSSFLRALRYVVIDECHTYRGVFGSHVAQVLRRLRRLCARYGSDPVFLLASATASDPAEAAGRLTGVPVVEVTDDASPRGELAFALWEPPLTELSGERGAPVRRTAVAEAADLLTDLVVQGTRTVAFVRSRRGAELVSVIAKERLAEVDASLPSRVGAYRGGYLPEERRAIERDLHDGRLPRAGLHNGPGAGRGRLRARCRPPGGLPRYAGLPVAAGGPRRARRPGRPGRPHRPRRPLGHVSRPPPGSALPAPRRVHRARPRQPVRPRPAPVRGRGGASARRGRSQTLRSRGRRSGGPVGAARPAAPTGRMAGTGPAASAPPTSPTSGAAAAAPSASSKPAPGGCSARSTPPPRMRRCTRERSTCTRAAPIWCSRLDLEDAVALVEAAEPSYSTMARDTVSVSVLDVDQEESWGDARLCFGSVEVTNQVVSYLRQPAHHRRGPRRDQARPPPRTLRTRAVWWTMTDAQLDAADIHPEELPGALHAAEHASIGLLPLFATCDRWDIGGVSIALHPDTGLPTVFVYDGHPGGAGFAERAFHTARAWLTATREAIASCECDFGCPSCVQSPKCGNGNDPLDKAAAVRVLNALLA